MGGPSGNDGDGGFTSPYNAQVNAHSNVNELSSDDHSINIHNKDIHSPPPPIPYGPALGPGAGPFGPALGPGAGPFPKRSWPAGGTAEGGPSGDDEGQVFNMPITANVKTDVSESTQDDHSIDVKNKDVHPAPVFVAPVHPPFAGPPGPPGPGGPPSGFRTATGKSSDHFHIPATEMAKRFGPAAGGTAMGGPGDGGHHGAPGPYVPGGTAMGGPSGDDDDWTFNVPETANVHSSVNEHYKDDHSVDIKDKDIYPPPFGVPFKRGLYPHAAGGTAMGGPSGNDGGQEFNMPITANIDTSVDEDYKDDHSIDLKHKDVYPPPPHFGGPHFPRAYSPSREGGSGDDYPPVAGGTAMGGPSGDDSDGGFNAPKSVDVDSNVNEDHEDNHAIKLDTTTVHPPSWNIPEHPVEVHEVHEEVPQMPWMSYEEQQHHAANPAPPSPEAPPQEPPAHRDDHEEETQCSAQIHEVVHTVTKTQYKEVQATKTVYQQVVSQAAQTSAVPMSAIPMQSGSAPKIMSSAVHSEVAYASAPASSYAPYESYKYKSQSPMSSPAAVYSMIPVNVPMGSSSSYMYSMATPAASHGANSPSGVSPEHSAMASASASPSSHSAMFTGAASRVSGGFVSAAAAVVGVLAFVL